jgi:hypothetical protein
MPKSRKKKRSKQRRKTAPLTTADLAAILHLIQPPMNLGVGNLALSMASLRTKKPARTSVEQKSQLTGDDLALISRLLSSPIILPVEQRRPAKRKRKFDLDDLFKESGKGTKQGHGGYSGPRLR